MKSLTTVATIDGVATIYLVPATPAGALIAVAEAYQGTINGTVACTSKSWALVADCIAARLAERAATRHAWWVAAGMPDAEDECSNCCAWPCQCAAQGG